MPEQWEKDLDDVVTKAIKDDWGQDAIPINWTIQVAYQTPEQNATNRTAYAYYNPSGQSTHVTVGLLHLALNWMLGIGRRDEGDDDD